MFPVAQIFMKTFVRNEEGRLPIEHVLASAAVAVIVIAAASSIGPHATRAYGGHILGSSEASNSNFLNGASPTKGEEKGKGSAAGPSFLAHLTTVGPQSATPNRNNTVAEEPVPASKAFGLAETRY